MAARCAGNDLGIKTHRALPELARSPDTQPLPRRLCWRVSHMWRFVEFVVGTRRGGGAHGPFPGRIDGASLQSVRFAASAGREGCLRRNNFANPDIVLRVEKRYWRILVIFAVHVAIPGRD